VCLSLQAVVQYTVMEEKIKHLKPVNGTSSNTTKVEEGAGKAEEEAAGGWV